MQAIFPESIDGDLLRLIHLSNGFKILNSARPFKVDDKCQSVPRILAVTNNDSGKTVTVTGQVLRDGEPVIEVRSSFLYRGRFSDYENTFQIIDEPDYVVELNDTSAAGVLQSKEWFDWDNDAKPLLPGTKLIFRVRTEVAYKNKTTYFSVDVTGKVYVRDQLKTPKSLRPTLCPSRHDQLQTSAVQIIYSMVLSE
jgi:fatty acid synthase subunit alpha